MAYYDFKKASGGGGSNTVYLTNNLKIAYNASTAKSNPLDSNNYISVSNNVVTFKRNSSYGLWLSTPYALESGKIYAFSYDSITNGDGKIYMDSAPNGIPETGDVSITRFNNISLITGLNGFAFKVSNSGYYGFQIWSGNTNDIVITNPALTLIE